MKFRKNLYLDNCKNPIEAEGQRLQDQVFRYLPLQHRALLL